VSLPETAAPSAAPTPTARPAPSATLALALGILAVSTAAIFIRLAQREAPSLVIAAYRLTLAALVLAPPALLAGRTRWRSLTRRAWLGAAAAGLFLALHFASWITSLAYTNIASSVVLVTTTPLWVALLTPFTLREPLARRVWLGLGLALLGGAAVALTDVCRLTPGGLVCGEVLALDAAALWGDGLALFGAWMAAAYLLIGRAVQREAGVALPIYLFLVYGAAGIVLLGLTLLARQPLTGYPPPTYLWLVLLALVPQVIGHSIFNWALKTLSAAYVSVTLLGEPIGSTLLAFLFLGETPTPLKLIGAILILAGIWITARSA
jgi:drug/metabolite transporter (DMT)-like permease